MKKTKIVCTIGPASESEDMLEKLMKAGMNVARLNFSHGSHDEHAARIRSIRKIAKKLEKNIGILLDTKGPEIRTHDMKDGIITLEKGSHVIVSMQEVEGTAEKFSVTYENLINDVEVGSFILLDDGLIELEVESIDHAAGEVHCKVLNTGELKNKKGVNLPGVRVNLPGITDKDAEDIRFGIEQDVDFIAASFVRRASDVLEIRKILEEVGNRTISIIPKIENQEGIDNIEEILEVSDGLMVARGDMGVEIPPEAVPIVQKDLIRKCNKLGKPVITATQMLDSMQRNPRATRAEASDVANAIYDGTDAVMLSGETAAGAYPEEAVKAMHDIAVAAEQAQNYKQLLSDRTKLVETSLVNAIGVSAAHTALNLSVKAIVAATESGKTARTISKYRPKSDIIAVTPFETTARQCTLVWGVYPVVREGNFTTDELLNNSVATAIESERVENGDLLIIIAGVPTGESGTTNLMKLHLVGEDLASGQGIGRNSAVGRTVVVNNGSELKGRDLDQAVIVTPSIDESIIPYLDQAVALVTEEAGLTSSSAIIGLEKGIPTVVGVNNVVDKIPDNALVTVDATQGRVYEGYANVL
ncbi:pyruvate kinase [Staphylococcus pseudintermedius]|nr:pyruvate kinase [Staphylococcus pseudintermedius]